jgi:putative hydrolase of the HAD superfamily
MKCDVCILIDADDTLWDNNIYYEKAMGEFLSLLEVEGFARTEIEPQLRVKEMENVKFHGYGSKSFAVTLLEVYEEVTSRKGEQMKEHVIRYIDEAREITRGYRINLLKGVGETLPWLAENFRLILFTKGENQEQMSKIERSGIAEFFQATVVVPEKNEEVYRKVLEEQGLVPGNTWMIGNSPRSDVNPAKAVGMKTVLIPYHATWEHEIEEIQDNGQATVILEDFSGLMQLLARK